MAPAKWFKRNGFMSSKTATKVSTLRLVFAMHFMNKWMKFHSAIFSLVAWLMPHESYRFDAQQLWLYYWSGTLIQINICHMLENAILKSEHVSYTKSKPHWVAQMPCVVSNFRNKKVGHFRFLVLLFRYGVCRRNIKFTYLRLSIDRA